MLSDIRRSDSRRQLPFRSDSVLVVPQFAESIAFGVHRNDPLSRKYSEPRLGVYLIAFSESSIRIDAN